MHNTLNIGVISDTHGHLTKKAQQAFQGVDHVLHAGDIGGPEILKVLETIAPVTAVRGNMDLEAWTQDLPLCEFIEFNQQSFYMLHILEQLDLDPAVAKIKAVVSGHTHYPDITYTNDVLFFNPGSASSGRYGIPTSVGRIHITPHGLHPEIVYLKDI